MEVMMLKSRWELSGLLLIVTGIVTKNETIKDHLWIVLSCQTAIALGTLLGGWRIVKTMGQKITKLKPFEGFCAESAGAITLFGATHFGIPVSTTHVITGAIIGAGARKGVSAVKWGCDNKNILGLVADNTCIRSCWFFNVLSS